MSHVKNYNFKYVDVTLAFVVFIKEKMKSNL